MSVPLRIYLWSAAVYIVLAAFSHRRFFDPQEFFAEVVIAAIPVINTIMCVGMLFQILDEEVTERERRKRK